MKKGENEDNMEKMDVEMEQMEMENMTEDEDVILPQPQQSTTSFTIPDFLRDFSDSTPKNGESWTIVCWVSSQNCLYENICNNFNDFCQNCSNRFTDARSRLAQNCLYENICNNFNDFCQNCSNRFTD